MKPINVTEDCLQRITNTLDAYSIPFFADKPPKNLVANGTLAEFGESVGIITAAHILKDESFQKENKFYLITFSGEFLVFQLSSLKVTVQENQNPLHNSECPDIALIELPCRYSHLRANKFFNLDTQRNEVLRTRHEPKDAYATNGVLPYVEGFFTSEEEKVRNPSKSPQGMCGIGAREQSFNSNGWDGFRIKVNFNIGSGFGRDFSCYSGTGVWKVRIISDKPDAAGNAFENPLFYGAIFNQENGINNSCKLTCHGPKSIYRLYDLHRARFSIGWNPS